MAARPTKSSGNTTKQNNRQANCVISDAISNLCKNFSNSNEEINNETRSGICEATTTATGIENNAIRTGSTALETDIKIAPITSIAATTNLIGKKTNCDCTNISIMHLFHEMKQEFPTIPDQIVAQHVNENCHQRDNCLKLLKTELALHPAPVQAYPGKVLQQLQQTIPKKPLKPLRKAPVPNSFTTTTTTTAAVSTTIVTPTTSLSYPNVSYSSLMRNQLTEELNEHFDVIPVMQQESEDDQEPCMELPRPRPTTLNLFPTQKQQYQQLQVQLKQHIQQRNQQQQQQQQLQYDQQLQQNEQPKPKPVRRAPLPPVPPKPMHLNSVTPAIKHKQSPSTPNKAEADISVNVALLSPATIAFFPNSKSASFPTTTTTKTTPNCQLNGSKSADQSPVHRAILNMQPQTPCLNNSSILPPIATGQKSFTSLNLTLRQPSSVTSTPPATIDIAAGPVVSGGISSGLMYTSRSYNAQQGYQKTFNITVSDEGSEIHASSIRSPQYITSPIHEDVSDSSNQSAPMQRCFENSSPMVGATALDEYQDIADKLELQKACRDKLASALRDNKKRLNQTEQQINILTDNVCPDVTVRLDDEIQRLRTACESMLNEIEFVRRSANENQSIMNRSFPTQNNWQQRSMPSLAIDNCATSATNAATTAAAAASASAATTPSNSEYCSEQQQQLHPYQQRSPCTPQQQQRQATLHDYIDSPSDEDIYGDEDEDREEECPLETWACNMCTFRNHPQLNICECCENVRILPEVLSREDIHITLSAGQNRIVHSWIVS